MPAGTPKFTITMNMPRSRFGATSAVSADDVGNDSAKSDAGEEAQHHELRQRGGRHRGQCQAAEHTKPDQDGFLATETVSHEPKQRRTEQQPEYTGREHGNELGGRNVPFLDQLWPHVAYRGQVEPVAKHHEGRDYQEHGRRRPDLLAVDQII